MRFSVLCISLLLFSCNAIPKLDIQGHRGARGLFPENTIPAFEAALKLGVNTLELDVVVSKDGQVVVSHEPFMNHEITLDVNGNPISESDEKSFNLYHMSYDSIRLYDVGSKLHPRFPNQIKMKVAKPLLSEVIKTAEKQSGKKIRYNIEIKSLPGYDGLFSPEVDEFVRLALEIIKSEKISKRTTLQSFDVRALESIHRQAPKIKTVLLVDGNESIDAKLSELTFKPKIISPYFELLDIVSVEKYHRQNFKVIPWTLNSEKDMKLMMEYKVDGIISDFPDLLLKVYRTQLRTLY
jgi:glycerophosphoryl diester phosphodiesterase